MVFWNKNKIKELNMIDIFFSYFSKVGKTDIKIKIDDKDLNRKIISNVNKEDLSKLQLCNIPVFKIQSLYDENLTSKHIVEFENNFVNMEDVLLDQDAYNLYKIGLEIIYELNNSKYLEVDKFKIEIEEGSFTCDYCNSGFRSIYYVYYDKKLLFKTKHNNLPEENNCPFLFNLEDSIEENLVVNKNIIIQLLFEALKIKYKNKINFYISEDNEKFVKLENISRIQKEDCCIGYGKDNLYNKSILIYKNFIDLNKNEMIIIVSNNYVKIKLENNKLKFYDIKDMLFGDIDFIKDDKMRFYKLQKITTCLAKKFNLVMDSDVYKDNI